jgi:hypothetical protein
VLLSLCMARAARSRVSGFVLWHFSAVSDARSYVRSWKNSRPWTASLLVGVARLSFILNNEAQPI